MENKAKSLIKEAFKKYGENVGRLVVIQQGISEMTNEMLEIRKLLDEARAALGVGNIPTEEEVFVNIESHGQ